jgi:hypothetical protein
LIAVVCFVLFSSLFGYRPAGSVADVMPWSSGHSFSGLVGANVGRTGMASRRLDELLGIDCSSHTRCWTVGDEAHGHGSSVEIFRWDGRRWSEVSHKPFVVGISSSLEGVTCVSSSDCWAVGYSSTYAPHYATFTLLVNWNGRRWLPFRTTRLAGALEAVSCVTTADCWAVGTSQDGTLILHWNGRGWNTSGPTWNGQLMAVACPTVSECWASGGVFQGPNTMALWDGQLWKTVRIPQPRQWTGIGFYLRGLDCVSPTDCWADGSTAEDIGFNETLHWNGRKWAVVPAGRVNHGLAWQTGIECATPADCWAIGAAWHGIGQRNSIRHWNGRRWSVAKVPWRWQSGLRGTVCVSSDDCWAIGSAYNNLDRTRSRNEALHWNGRRWHVVAVPQP